MILGSRAVSWGTGQQKKQQHQPPLENPPQDPRSTAQRRAHRGTPQSRL